MSATRSPPSRPTARRTGSTPTSRRPGGRSADYLLLSGFLTHRLTGRFVDSVASQVGYVPFDYKRFRWAAPATGGGGSRRSIPTGCPSSCRRPRRSAISPRAAASALGLPRRHAGHRGGRPTRPARCSAPGALEPHIGAISYGTTATINTTQRRYVEAIPLVPPYPAAIPGSWSLEVQVYRGYWMVEWFKREFGSREVQLAEELGVTPEALFDDLLRETPAGSMGLILQPYWSPGVRVPGPEAKGAIIGFGDVHTRAHLYRAILEGLAYALREGGERTATRAKVPLRELRVSGGGAQSPAAVQLTADIFGLPTAPAAHPRDVGARRGDRRSRRAGDPPGYRDGRPRDDPRRRGARPGPRPSRPLRRPVRAGLPPDVRAAEAALRGDPRDHRLSAAEALGPRQAGRRS